MSLVDHSQIFTRCINRCDTVDTFPFDILRYIRKCKEPNGHPRFHRRSYADIICTFDIEATNMDEIKQAVMYHWQACIDGLICVGRTWDEFETFLQQIDKWLPEGLCMVFYVHNLGYEFQFLRAVHDFQPDEVFCLTGRKVAKCEIGSRFEFRCSYCLTNMSLREFLKKMGVEHQKGELDYTVRRFPWTPMTDQELEYCIIDVLGLYEALRVMFKSYKNTIADVPLTSTGYVRTDFKRAMRQGGYLPMVHECAPSYDVYLALRRAFRGGNTHANRCYTGIILENVTSYDRASSYPDVLVNMPYPVMPFIKDDTRDPDQLLDGFPYVMCIDFFDMELSDPFYGCPYLSIHKCYNLQGAINDNGRVVKAKRFQTWLTDIDLAIVRQQYKWSRAVITTCYRSEYGLLPAGMKDVTMEYYERKTKLKGVKGQEVYYMKAKNKLNSIYGMCATNPVRTSLVFNGHDFDVAEVDEREALKKANKKSFTVFAWGCWCTAWARWWLEKAIRLCGDQFVYCDTDSVKYVGQVDFSELNAEIQTMSEKHHAYADDPAGVRHYLGVYEHDDTYNRFCTLGAKKYAYEDEDGRLHITIAGVSKRGAAEMGCLENFKEGFIFRESAGQEAYYNDDWMEEPVEIDGHLLAISPNIYLQQGEYTLGLTLEYKRLFHLTQEQFDKILKTR